MLKHLNDELEEKSSDEDAAAHSVPRITWEEESPDEEQTPSNNKQEAEAPERKALPEDHKQVATAVADANEHKKIEEQEDEYEQVLKEQKELEARLEAAHQRRKLLDEKKAVAARKEIENTKTAMIQKLEEDIQTLQDVSAGVREQLHMKEIQIFRLHEINQQYDAERKAALSQIKKNNKQN